MAYLEMASKDLRFTCLLGKFELGLKEFLFKNGLDKPVLVRNIFEHDPGDPELRPELARSCIEHMYRGALLHYKTRWPGS